MMEHSIRETLEGYLEVLSLRDHPGLDWRAEDICAAFEWSKALDGITKIPEYSKYIDEAIKVTSYRAACNADQMI